MRSVEPKIMNNLRGPIFAEIKIQRLTYMFPSKYISEGATFS